MELLNKISPQAQTSQELEQTSQFSNHLRNPGIIGNISQFEDWFLGSIEKLRETGLVIYTITGRNGAGKTTLANTVFGLLLSDIELYKEALRGNRDKRKIINFLEKNQGKIDVYNLPATTIVRSLFGPESKYRPQQKDEFGRVSETGYQYATRLAAEMIDEILENRKKSGRATTIIIQQGLPAIYNADPNAVTLDTLNPNKPFLERFRFVQEQTAGPDRLNSLALALAADPQIGKSVWWAYLIRDGNMESKVINERPLLTAENLTHLNEYVRFGHLFLRDKFLRKGQLAFPLSPEEEIILKRHLDANMMEASKIDPATRQQQAVIRRLGEWGALVGQNEQEYACYLAAQAGLTAGSEQCLIGENPRLSDTPELSRPVFWNMEIVNNIVYRKFPRLRQLITGQ